MHSLIKTVPIVDNRVISDEAVFSLYARPGWYIADVFKRELIRPASLGDLLKVKAPIRGWSLRGKIIPQSFDTARRFLSKAAIESWRFEPELQDFDLLFFKKIRGQLFYVRKDMPEGALFMPRMALQNGEKLASAKGLSPEQVYLLGCYAMILSEAKARLEAETLPNKIKRAFSFSGAKLLEFKEAAKGIIDIFWEYLSQRFVSQVRETDLRVLDAGVCLAGSDDRQTLSSLPHVIKEAIDGDKLVITRREANEEEEEEEDND